MRKTKKKTGHFVRVINNTIKRSFFDVCRWRPWQQNVKVTILSDFVPGHMCAVSWSWDQRLTFRGLRQRAMAAKAWNGSTWQSWPSVVCPRLHTTGMLPFLNQRRRQTRRNWVRVPWTDDTTVIHFYFRGVQFSIKRKFAISVCRKKIR